MYLNILNNRKKELFIELAINVATADGIFSDEERNVIGAYCKEMEISYYFEGKVESVEKILIELNSISSSKEKRIIAFEVIGLCFADGAYQKEEKSIVSLMESIFEIQSSYVKECENIVSEYMKLQKAINELVLEGC